MPKFSHYTLSDISAYICTYDEEKNIEDCIASVRANRIARIVVVDSSPSAGTGNIARESGADVLRTSKGLASQRQIAIDHCTTSCLLFVDADDRLDSRCAETLLKDMISNGYNAVQAGLRIRKPDTFWQKGMDAQLAHCICSPGPSKMIGRPALYETKWLKRVGMDLSFNGIGNEDAALAIKMEKAGARSGIGHGISFRLHPSGLRENIFAWKKYGLGDAKLFSRYPLKKINIVKHLIFTYPLKRSYILLTAKKGRYIPFTILTGLFRFFFMQKAFLEQKIINWREKSRP